MGKLLMENTSGLFHVKDRSAKSRKERLEWFCADFHSMKTLKEEHCWFESLMEVVIVGVSDDNPSNDGNHSTGRLDKLSMLQKSDGYVIGSQFIYQLSRAATEEGAYKRWLKKFPSVLKEFDSQHAWFKPLMMR